MIQFKPPIQRPLAAPNLVVRDVQKRIMAAVLWAPVDNQKDFILLLQRACFRIAPFCESLSQILSKITISSA